MSTDKKSTVRKSLDQQIEDAREKLKSLEAQKAEKGLEKTSLGMEKLLAELENVIKQNKCKTVDVLRSINRIKKVGATIQVKERAPRKKLEKK